MVSGTVWRWSALVVGFALASACGRTGLFGDHRGWGGDDFGDEGNFDDDDFEPGEQTCQQVDFLFVIDNSGSMEDNQLKLLNEYDTFVDGFAETVERLESVHVGVITTDEYEGNSTQCRHLGGLVVETDGVGSSRAACGPYPGGTNYMTDLADLEESFPCAARVGVDGSGKEEPIAAAISAISPPLTDEGSCNAGFIRPGALLVIVLVTDEDIDLDPLFSVIALSEAKGDDDRNIVFVALANGPDSGCDIDQDTRIASGLADLVNLFSHGFLAPICAPNYADVFQEAIDVATAACMPG
jgi:hypothetical protein